MSSNPWMAAMLSIFSDGADLRFFNHLKQKYHKCYWLYTFCMITQRVELQLYVGRVALLASFCIKPPIYQSSFVCVCVFIWAWAPCTGSGLGNRVGFMLNKLDTVTLTSLDLRALPPSALLYLFPFTILVSQIYTHVLRFIQFFKL